eukprot:TRINITY_DN24825_c0_g1_i1.p1 TRINITY_DN24825_c0_g1~~TRINITY_DN24825_c0_g1_i1.p1  ORF type:complete len:231 (+),score=13.60 TRINITY_DN24825_c0_g1_i1:39-731(+)
MPKQRRKTEMEVDNEVCKFLEIPLDVFGVLWEFMPLASLRNSCSLLFQHFKGRKVIPDIVFITKQMNHEDIVAQYTAAELKKWIRAEVPSFVRGRESLSYPKWKLGRVIEDKVKEKRTFYWTGRGSRRRAPKAGLTFPVYLARRRLRKTLLIGSKRLSLGTAVYMTAVMEYLAAELVELAGNATKHHKRKRITPQFISLAVKGDEELNHLFAGVIMPGGYQQNHWHKGTK